MSAGLWFSEPVSLQRGAAGGSVRVATLLVRATSDRLSVAELAQNLGKLAAEFVEPAVELHV